MSCLDHHALGEHFVDTRSAVFEKSFTTLVLIIKDYAKRRAQLTQVYHLSVVRAILLDAS